MRQRVEGTGRADRVPRRPLTAVVAAAIVLALAGLVAVASHGTPVWTSLREGQANRSEILTNVAVFGGVGLIVALATALILHRTLIANRPGAPPLRTTLLRALPIATVALAALALLSIARTPLVTEVVPQGADPRADERRLDPDPAVRPNARRADFNSSYGRCDPGERCAGANERDPAMRRYPPDRPGGDRPGGDETSGGNRPQPSPPLARAAVSDSDDGGGGADVSGLGPILLILLGALAAAIVGAIVWSRYRNASARREYPRESDDPLPSPDAAAAHGAVASTIDAMLADPDPNAAIIGAYARLLEGLAACDVGRRDHEAPMEHLRRALTTLHVRPEPLHRLIGLFEMARFSTHALTESHRDQALDALQAAAADLAVAPLPSVTAGARPIEALR